MTMAKKDKDDDQGGKRDAVYTLDAGPRFPSAPSARAAERAAPDTKKQPSLAGRRFSVW